MAKPKVLISGASSGIGRKMVELFYSAGFHVLMVARRHELLNEIKALYPETEFLACDLSDPQSFQLIEKTWGSANQGLHTLINNAGGYRPQNINNDEDSAWDYHYQTNLMSAVRLTRIFWPQLTKQKGSIINISSTLALRPIAQTAAYSALKAAMNNWTQSLAIEGAPHGLRANAICPGIVDTPIHSYMNSNRPEDQKIYQAVQSAQPLGRTGRPEDVAQLALYLAQSQAEWITGTVINVDGGILLNS